MDETQSRAQERLEELGAGLTQTKRGNIYTLTIIGQIEGHQAQPETIKTTKYEHVLPLLATIEESEDIDGLLLLLTITAHRFPDPPSVNQHERQKGNIQHQYRQRSVNQQSCRHPKNKQQFSCHAKQGGKKV